MASDEGTGVGRQQLVDCSGYHRCLVIVFGTLLGMESAGPSRGSVSEMGSCGPVDHAQVPYLWILPPLLSMLEKLNPLLFLPNLSLSH